MAWRPRHRLLRSERSLLPQRGKKWSFLAAALFPNRYAAAMSNLGFLTLWEVMHSFPQIFPQRFFTDVRGSLEEGRELSAFPVIAASISYEMDYINLVSLLRRGGVAVRRRERMDALLIVGGAAPTINPIPLAEVADAVFLGEGREHIQRIFELVCRLRPGFAPKDEILRALSTLPGVWVPALSPKPPERVSSAETLPPSSPVTSSLAAFPNMVLVQLQRGCPFSCPFCATPVIYNPFLNFEADSVLESVSRWGRLSRVGLVGSAIAEYPKLAEVVDELQSRGAEVYTSSLRADRVDERVLSALSRSAQKTLTFAPEAAAGHLKRTIGKEIDAQLVVDVAKRLAPKELKLYYIVGLPGEDEADVEEIVREVRAVASALKGCFVVVSVNPFVPKRGTPWGEVPMAPHEELLRRFEIVRSGLSDVFGVRVDVNYSRRLRLQWAFSCGGFDVAEALASANSAAQLAKKLREAGWDV